jgi:peptide/nickel transport system ATP-binding protein
VPPLSGEFAGCRFAPRCAQAMTAAPAPAATAAGGARARGALPAASEAQHQAGTPVAAATVAAQPPGAGPCDGDSRRLQTLLQVQDLSVRFAIRGGVLQRPRGWFDAVKNVSFDVARGETLALVGESGCGKTTTGKAIVQLLRTVAHIDGRAMLDGKNLFDCRAPSCAPRAGASRSSSRTRLRR